MKREYSELKLIKPLIQIKIRFSNRTTKVSSSRNKSKILSILRAASSKEVMIYDVRVVYGKGLNSVGKEIEFDNSGEWETLQDALDALSVFTERPLLEKFYKEGIRNG